MKEEMMKVHPEERVFGFPIEFPMSLFNEDQAQTNHGQSLATLNSRGGLSPSEMLANIERRRFKHIDKQEAMIKIIRYMDELKEFDQPAPEEWSSWLESVSVYYINQFGYYPRMAEVSLKSFCDGAEEAKEHLQSQLQSLTAENTRLTAERQLCLDFFDEFTKDPMGILQRLKDNNAIISELLTQSKSTQ